MGKIYYLYGHSCIDFEDEDYCNDYYNFCFPLNCDHLEKEIREVIKIIDNLWVKHSKNHFGFSVQKQVWTECKGIKLSQINNELILTTNNPRSIYFNSVKKFGNRVGWRNWLKGWLDYSSLTFSLNAPSGHLPRLAWEDMYLEECHTELNF